jgi:hypothetical protein
MKRTGTFGSDMIAVALVALALCLPLRCIAEATNDVDFATMQGDAKTAFKEEKW